ncbi:MAG: hypothetical protein QM535_20690 [Limnohabitans sp.]|nr:hypothetical protein [Limnohabitans sp.]
MDNTIKNTKFDNLVNYETHFSSNSSRQFIPFQSSADPNSLSSLIMNSQLIEYSLIVMQEKKIQQTDIEMTAE